MSTVADKWKDEIVGAYTYSNQSVTPINAAGASAYFKITTDYEKSRERILMIARRILSSQRHDPASLTAADPLFEKNRLRITFRENNTQQTFDIEIQDQQDVEQMELFRVNHTLLSRLPPPTLVSSCSIQ